MSIYRLSHSSLELMHKCERLYQLERILTSYEEDKVHFPATVLGTAFGRGVASYFQHQDHTKALFDLWLGYYPLKEDDRRTQEIAANMLICSFPIIDKMLEEWEIISFNGKPAVELSFKIVIDELFYFVGYVDFVLRNKFTGKVLVFDAKSTGLQLHDLSPIYKNSTQCIGYSVVLDAICGPEITEYDIAYFVGQLGSGTGFEPKIIPLQFTKNLHDRLDWFITLGMDVKHIKEMIELNIFPRRGDSCLQYNKPCKHFNTCHLHTLDREAVQKEDEKEYQFHFTLEELIESHIQRISV